MKNSIAKIVLIGTFLPSSQPGGVTVHCSRLAARLENEPGFAVRKINVKLRGPTSKSLLKTNPLTWAFAAIAARCAGFTLFHFNTSSRNFPFLVLAPLVWLLRGKILLSFHSGALAANLSKTGFVKSLLFRFSLALADCVLFMNERESKAVAKQYPQFAAKFQTIHPFIIPPKPTAASPTRPCSSVLSDVVCDSVVRVSPCVSASAPNSPSATPATAPSLVAPQGRDVHNRGCSAAQPPEDAPLSQSPAGARLSGPPPAPPFTVAAMGAWLPYYFFEDVIAVLESIAAKNSSQKFALIIASALFNLDLNYKRTICAKITEINAAPNNLHVSYRENVEDSLAFLSEADLLVRSSGVDSFGMCVAEALFLGKPAIATNVCRRVNGTRLYEPRDLKQLEAHVAEVYARARTGTLEKIALDPAEDAFPLLRKLYQKEAAATAAAA